MNKTGGNSGGSFHAWVQPVGIQEIGFSPVSAELLF